MFFFFFFFYYYYYYYYYYWCFDHVTGNDQCVIRRSKEMTIFLNNSLFKNEMLQKTAEMYEQDKKELRYEVRNFIFYCENHMTNVKTDPFHFPISQWKRSKH